MDKLIRYQGKPLAYSIDGNGPAVLLLHGFMESRKIWEVFGQSLQKQFTVICPDLPGHGESSVFAGQHTMDLMAGAVEQLLLEEGISDWLLVGHSMGGYVALQMAVNNPSRVKGLVLFHSHAQADSDEARQNRLRTINLVKADRKGFIRQFIPDLFYQENVAKFGPEIESLQTIASQCPAEGIVAALAGMRDRADRQQVLKEATFPILFVLGKHDSRMPFDHLLAQAAMPSHSEVLLLDQVGHMGYIEARSKTLAAIRHFAQRAFDR